MAFGRRGTEGSYKKGCNHSFAAICVNLSPSMTVPKDDRRTGQRIPASVPVAITNTEGNLQLSGQTRDLSTSGIFLYTNSHISEGSQLEMVLILPPELTQGEKRWVCCQASVVRVEDKKDGNFGVAASIRNMDVLPEILG
jgi:hypothetical protein